MVVHYPVLWMYYILFNKFPTGKVGYFRSFYSSK